RAASATSSPIHRGGLSRDLPRLLRAGQAGPDRTRIGGAGALAGRTRWPAACVQRTAPGGGASRRLAGRTRRATPQLQGDQTDRAGGAEPGRAGRLGYTAAAG